MNVDDVLRAAARRAQLPHTDVLRLVDDGADACAGLVVERFGSVVRLEVRATRWPAWLDACARALVAALPGVTEAIGVLRVAGGRSEMRVVVGSPPDAHVVHEEGRRFLVRTTDAEAVGVGVFPDHRIGRAWVQRAAHGGRVLNLFAHAGAFGVAAVCGGAARVDHVDAARKCAPWAALNLALNGIDPRGHRFIVDDALAIAKRAASRKERYRVVVCDPPTTALRPDGRRFHVERDLTELAGDCVGALEPGGALLLSTNDRSLSVGDVERAARDGAARAGRQVARVDEVPLPADFPSAADPTLRPMRGVFLRCSG